MSENIFEKFNAMFDVEGLKEDINKAEENSGEFVEVPKGDYEVKIVKLELGETSEKSKNPGAPMGKVWFEIVAGDYKGQKIFQNQMLTTGFGIHKMNELLNSFETGIKIYFENFTQYNDLFNQVFDAIDGKAEYALSYKENNKGFPTYTIVQRFDLMCN